jgi:hypothetical protein
MFRSDDYRTVCEVLFRGVLSSLVYDSSNIPNDNSDSRRKLYIILLKNKETKINATLGVNFYTERFLCVFFFYNFGMFSTSKMASNFCYLHLL